MSTTSGPAAPPPVQATRPWLLDYALICLGAGMSAVLAEYSEVRLAPTSSESLLFQALLKTFAFQLFLPVGILLCWPIFYAGQRIRGRKQGLTIGEWLWGLAWLGMLALIAYFASNRFGALASLLSEFKHTVVLGYVLFMVSMGALAALVTVYNLLTLWRTQPWTHTFGLVLLMWPLAPLAVMWFLNLKFDQTVLTP